MIRHGFRYTLVSAICLAMHNLVVLGLDYVGVHYSISSAVSFIIVTILGFLLHSTFTFSIALTSASLARYAVGMSLNLPLSVALLFVAHDLLGLKMAVALSLATVLLMAWNYLVSRWTLARRAQEAHRCTI